ncbi:MAG: peptidylprolyl isomerase [Bacteroidota bacterium]
MNKTFISTFLSCLTLSCMALAQGTATKTQNSGMAPVPKAVFTPSDPVLMTISGENVSLSEFDRVFRKNNRDTVFTEKSVREYLDLYINYKLKVREAEALKMDTSETFKSELAGYRKQLAQPYLNDKEVGEQLIREAYDRLNKDVRASHILIRLDAEALPKDTLNVYNRIMKIREMVMKGADFAKVARDSSEDPSAKENSGDLGYFTGMQMVYPFETVAYSTKPGSVSMPVRTRFGFHIIKVVDVRAAQGELRVAHIMIRAAKDANDSTIAAANAKILEVKSALAGGMPWDSAVSKYSEDKGSARKGGELPWFGTGRMVPEFEKAAFQLKNVGDVSDVVKTTYGYHLIKLLEKRGVPSFDEKKAELKQLIARDSRNEASKASMIAKIKKRYTFKDTRANLDEFVNALDTSLLAGEWELTRVSKFTKYLFTLTDSGASPQLYTQQDFAKYIASHQTKRTGSTPQAVGYSMYDQWVGETCLSFYEARLDNLFPDFRNLMKEYRDGILLFDLTDKMVWSKAVKDSAGLESYYDQNKNNYLWGERFDAIVYSSKDSKALAEFKKQLVKGKKPVPDILLSVNKSATDPIVQKEARFAKGENELVDACMGKTGAGEMSQRNDVWYLVDVKQAIPVGPKSIDEARGLITADYQNYLEKNWISSLQAKYAVSVDQGVLSKMWK